jgi:hypothetical protein
MTNSFDKYITDEQKKAILEQRINQLAAEGYQHNINLQIATNSGNEALIEESSNAIAIIGNAIEVHENELEGLA